MKTGISQSEIFMVILIKLKYGSRPGEKRLNLWKGLRTVMMLIIAMNCTILKLRREAGIF